MVVRTVSRPSSSTLTCLGTFRYFVNIFTAYYLSSSSSQVGHKSESDGGPFSHPSTRRSPRLSASYCNTTCCTVTAMQT